MIAGLRALLNRFPGLKRLLRYLLQALPAAGVSSHYVRLEGEQATAESSRLRAAWQAQELPARQRELVERQLATYRHGESVDVFDIMVRALRDLPSDVRGLSLLEIGCSSGFYSEVLDIAGFGVGYAGCDYAEPFIALARQKYPALRFDVADATALRYADEAFDIVISGCCLLHIPEYRAGVAETARVARQYAIFHRTPVVLGQPTVYYRKQAYGVETVEIHFNEPQFLSLLADCGLEVIATYTLDESVSHRVGAANRTYVCKKSTP
ncbi:class I SAM-dependent methyltransferase [Ferrovibrio xuzhouensis]|uniref:Class I SAM-dependent methyltransferase n=1 Tax=Ferrovibrio xuzhouensis TaxID=1576914 RepID=A0ABV7VLE9_9PROT